MKRVLKRSQVCLISNVYANVYTLLVIFIISVYSRRQFTYLFVAKRGRKNACLSRNLSLRVKSPRSHLGSNPALIAANNSHDHVLADVCLAAFLHASARERKQK